MDQQEESEFRSPVALVTKGATYNLLIPDPGRCFGTQLDAWKAEGGQHYVPQPSSRSLHALCSGSDFMGEAVLLEAALRQLQLASPVQQGSIPSRDSAPRGVVGLRIVSVRVTSVYT